MVMTLQDVCLERRGKRVLNNISGELKAGQIVALLGPNGAGKSTLLKCMSGLFSGVQGVFLEGEPVAGTEPEILARKMAYLPQQSALHFPLTVSEVLELATLPFHLTRLEQRQQVLKIAEQWDIGHLKDRDFRQLSGGEQQRCQLARTFLQLSNCEGNGLWLLDEPSSSLDPEHQYLLQKICRQAANAGHCVVIILHDINRAMMMADQVWVMSEGELHSKGTATEVLTPELMSDVFRVKVQMLSDKNGNTAMVF